MSGDLKWADTEERRREADIDENMCLCGLAFLCVRGERRGREGGSARGRGAGRREAGTEEKRDEKRGGDDAKVQGMR